MHVRTLVAVILMAGVATNAYAQRPPTGFTTLDHAATGFRFFYPKTFDPTPTPPTELLILGRFAREKPYLARKNDRDRRPESFIVFALPPRATDGGASEKGSEAPTSYDDIVAKSNAINDPMEFMKSRFPDWSVDRSAVEEFDKDEARGYPVRPPVRVVGVPQGRGQEGYLYVRHAKGWAFGVVGVADAEVLERMKKDFRKVADSVHRPEGFGGIKDDFDKLYAGKEKNLRDIPFRIDARRQMIRGWEALDTENFLIIYHTKNDSLVRKVANDLEAVRPVYEQQFAPTQKLDAVSVVRICEDHDEYLTYGGRRGSAGYWNFVAKELVLFDMSKKSANEDWKAKSRPLEDSYLVLYHEAFHQYIYYAAGQLSPHDWFNEGLGDYFSGLTIYKNSKKVKAIEPSRWRIGHAKATVDSRHFIPLEQVLHAERAQYYNPGVIGQMYTEGWAICYFLMTSDEAKARPDWKDIIPTYYDELTTAMERQEATMTDETPLAQRQSAEKSARDAALRAALDGIDLVELEKVWKQWIRDIKDPWAASRGN